MKLLSETTRRKTLVERLLGEDSFKARVAADVVSGVKKGLLMAVFVASLHYADLKTRYEYVGPRATQETNLSKETFNCVTCHHYDPNVMKDYQRDD
ncbi:hypothetical protein HY638_05905 [Candidatus Woesearchaeota archaeon]|nr:hypothetical protein [Candidatus Woesearchaeota archaeon]